MNLGFWRDIALVLLALEAFLGVLVAGAACYFAIRGVRWLKANIPRVTRPARYYLMQTEQVVRRAGTSAVRPFIWSGATAARVRAAWRGLKRPERRNSHV
ncbi:MAG: hypothetical protein QHH80_02425 [Anaerolineae bacterium]|jgi:hypothetical protein|nr:hypothetical protein [Anaerolineae bacterium]